MEFDPSLHKKIVIEISRIFAYKPAKGQALENVNDFA